MIAVSLGWATYSFSQTTGDLYEGGLRLANIQCTCSAASLIMVYDYTQKRTLTLVYQPGASTLYQYYNLYSSTNILGSYNPYAAYGICQFEEGEECAAAEETGFTIDGLMDSLPGTGTSAS